MTKHNIFPFNFRSGEKVKDKSKGLSLKRKHDREDQPKKRGRPMKVDKPRHTPSSTPVLPVNIFFTFFRFFFFVF